MTAEECIDEGNTELAMGDLEKAAEWYEKATEAEPDCYEAWHALSIARMKLEQYEPAIEAGKKAIAINPQEPMAYTSLSLTYARNGQIPEAEEVAGKARILSWGGKVDAAD